MPEDDASMEFLSPRHLWRRTGRQAAENLYGKEQLLNKWLFEYAK